MITALTLLRIIKTSDWSRYTGTTEAGYVTAGTTGDDAIELRCSLADDSWLLKPIEYRHVRPGNDAWLPTGYSALMRYDVSRPQADDGDGYYFVPYKVTELTRTRTH